MVGRWAFITGIIIAVLTGFMAIPNIAFVMMILGLIVGFLNISEKESTPYLVAVIALLLVGISGIQSANVLGTSLAIWVQTILANFIAFVAASGLVVAVKQALHFVRD